MRLIRTLAAQLTLVVALTSIAWGQTRTPGVIPGCIYLSTPPTLTNKQQSPILCDVNGKISVTALPGGSTGQVQYNNAGAFGGMAGTSWDNTNRSLVITGTGSGTDPTFSIISGSAVTQFTALDNNNVGVGIATPLARFHVASTTGQISLFRGVSTAGFQAYENNAATALGYVGYGSAGQLFSDGISGAMMVKGVTALQFGSASTSAMTITTTSRIQHKGEIESSGSQPTAAGAGGTCTTGAIAGGANAGTVTLTAACVATDTVTLTFPVAVATGWACFATDRTSNTTLVFETATTTTTAVLTISGVASGATDIIQYACTGY